VYRYVCLALLLVAGTTGTAAEKVPPAVEVRVRAASDMIDVFDYLIKLLPKDDEWQQYLKIAKLIGESKNGFLGLDPTKPIGAYVGIANEVVDSPVVLMVPVAKESDFLGLLRTYLKLDPKKLKEGLYSFPVPKVPAGPAYIRFSHGYAYVTIRSAESIDPERLIQPKDFFAELPKDILNAKVFIDRFPADIRKSILGQLELGWHENIANLRGTPVEMASHKCLIDVGGDMLKTILEEGQSLDFTVRIAPKTDDIEAKLTLKPKAGTGLAKFLKDQSTRDSKAASMFAESTPNTINTTACNLALPPQTRKKVADLAGLMLDVEIAERKLEGEDKKDGKEIQRIAHAILMAGDLQASFRTGADLVSKRMQIDAALEVVDGDALEKVLRRVVERHEIKAFQLDVQKADRYRYHTLTPPEAVLAEKPLAFATGEKLWALSSDFTELQKAFERKPKPTPFFLTEIFYGSDAFGSPELAEKHFGKPVLSGSDRVYITIHGGDTLMIDAAMMGKVLGYLREANLEKKK
jgi:hypothetical protein